MSEDSYLGDDFSELIFNYKRSFLRPFIYVKNNLIGLLLHKVR